MPSYVVTGASRGIGLEFVRQLSAKADNVVFGLVRNRTGSKGLLDLAAERKNIHIFEADLKDYKSLKNAAAEVAKITSGTLDNLINNAAYVPLERQFSTLDAYDGQEELLEKDYLDNVNVNVLGVIHTINAFLPLLKASATRALVRVITLSSGIGDLDFTLETNYAGHAFYCISKAAVNMVVAKYATRFRDDNFVFLAISPGLVDTSKMRHFAADEETLHELGKFVGLLKKASPLWDGNAILPEESVTKMLAVIEKTDPKDSGAFISHFGDKRWV